MNEKRLMNLLLNAIDCIAEMNGMSVENNPKKMFEILNEDIGLTIEEYKKILSLQ